MELARNDPNPGVRHPTDAVRRWPVKVGSSDSGRCTRPGPRPLALLACKPQPEAAPAVRGESPASHRDWRCGRL